MFLGGEIEQAGVDDNIALSAANIGQTSASKAKGQLSVQVMSCRDAGISDASKCRRVDRRGTAREEAVSTLRRSSLSRTLGT